MSCRSVPRPKTVFTILVLSLQLAFSQAVFAQANLTRLESLLDADMGQSNALWRNESVLNAVVNSDWSNVHSQFGDIPEGQLDPVTRHLAAHAALASNAPNVAFELFGAASHEATQAWSTWTQVFAQSHAHSSTAAFLRADGFARTGDPAQALAGFDSAISLDSENAFAHHARGVLLAQSGKPNEATAALRKALSMNKQISDFHNSRGMVLLSRGSASPRRIGPHFKRALESATDFGLALHGKGYLSMVQDPDLALVGVEDLNAAAQHLPAGIALFDLNETNFIIQAAQKAGEYAVAGNEVTAGTELKKTAKEVAVLSHAITVRKDAQKDLTGLARIVSSGPEILGGYGIKAMEKQIAQKVLPFKAGQLDAFYKQLTSAQSMTVGDAIKSDRDSFKQQFSRAGSTASAQAGKALNTAGNYIDSSTVTISAKLSQANGIPGFKSNSGEVSIGVSTNIATGRAMQDAGQTLQNRQSAESSTLQNYNNHIQKSRAPEDVTTHSFAKHGPSSFPISNYSGLTIYTAPSGPAPNTQGGASMNKAAILWNDEIWPFVPIFTLLYPDTTQPEIQAVVTAK